MSAVAVTAPGAEARSRRRVAGSAVLPAQPQPRAAFAWRLEATLAAAGQARACVRWFLGKCEAVPEDVADTVVMVASELVANACAATVKLAGPGPVPPVELSLRLFADRLLVEVADTSPEVPRPRLAPDGEAEHGRGLAVVGALSLEWGYFWHRNLKIVYSTLPLTASEET